MKSSVLVAVLGVLAMAHAQEMTNMMNSTEMMDMPEPAVMPLNNMTMPANISSMRLVSNLTSDVGDTTAPWVMLINASAVNMTSRTSNMSAPNLTTIGILSVPVVRAPLSPPNPLPLRPSTPSTLSFPREEERRADLCGGAASRAP
jgi:hypothetical protein